MYRKDIPYSRQEIDDSDIAAVESVLKSDYLTTGPAVDKFEAEFANYVGARYAVAVSNGTAALHLACLAAGIGTGDEIITSPMTFAASANCALYVGATPVFADINDRTWNIEPEKIEKRITCKTRAIIPVHYTGLPCDLKEVNAIAKKHNLLVIEDACHALGAVYKDTKIGDCSFSDMAVFSFHPVKHVATGEGGMITTNNQELYKRLRILRNHGITRDESSFEENHGGWYYEMQMLGYNYRITDIQCALGSSQLKKIDRSVNRRREIAERYFKELGNLNLQFPLEPEGYFNSYHLFVIEVKEDTETDRKRLYNYLKDKNIHCQVHYIPVHLLPYYKKRFKYKIGDYPVAEGHYQKALSLPMYPGLTYDELSYVIASIKEVCR